ncbi:MAG: hypothetical protein ACRCVE_10185 [Plesiomonas sp.]
MSRIGSEHAILPVSSISTDFTNKPHTRQQSSVHDFMRLMSTRQETETKIKSHSVTKSINNETYPTKRQHAVYRLLNGPLRGVQLDTLLTDSGIQLTLYCPTSQNYKQLRRFQARLQRKLDRDGFPITLNVIDMSESTSQEMINQNGSSSGSLELGGNS